MLRVPVLIGLPRIFFLNAAGIRQHQLTEVFGPRRAEDASFVTLSSQPWKVADMVQVRVRENDGIEALGGNRKFVPVPEAKLFQPLEQSAVEQDPFSTVLEKIFGAGDRPRRTEKCEFRHATNDDIRVFRDPSRRLHPFAATVLLCPTWRSALF